jgi:hypothetical protein
MKIAKSTSLVFLLIASTSIQVLAQNQNKQATLFENIEKLNGNDIIERLSTQRNEFIKNRKNGKLPKGEYIINRNNLAIITFNGLDYFVKNNQIIGIQGLSLSDEVLAQITQKLALLDSVQYSYSEQSDIDFKKDRLFLLSLKMFSSTTRDIAALTKTANPSLNVENNVAKMRLPNIDKTLEPKNTQSLVQLYK